MCEILSLKPTAVWKHFHALTQVPRPSGHMEKITEFLVNFGKSLNLETLVDSVGNVIIRKPAKPGMENRKGLILQAHMDMVPQKNNDTVHDFVNDPIRTYVDGDWVKAKGTTLGADNGMGVAAIMAVLEDDSIQHGYLEALITVDEETGMYGAFGLKGEDIKGEVLLNLDSEDEGELYIGCAGGIDINITFQYAEVAPAEGRSAVKVVLKGLRGGHSGLEIDKGRGNANKLMVRFLHEAVAQCGARLASMHGGNMRNAIPREAEAVITVPAEKKEDVFKLAAEFEALFAEEYKTIEENISLKAEEVALPSAEMPEEMQNKVLNSLYACPNGVFRYIPTIPDTVETSTNLSVVKAEGGTVSVQFLTRSSSDSMKMFLAKSIESCFTLAGAKVEMSGAYSGWQPNVDSAILKSMREAYKNQFGVEPAVKVVHAGLECGIIGANVPGLDMISFGPTLRSPHSPDEKVLIPTVEKFYDFLVKSIENAPLK